MKFKLIVTTPCVVQFTPAHINIPEYRPVQLTDGSDDVDTIRELLERL